MAAYGAVTWPSKSLVIILFDFYYRDISKKSFIQLSLSISKTWKMKANNAYVEF